MKGKLPELTKNHWISMDPDEFEMIKEKVDKVRSRCYISGGTVPNLTVLFYVPKGDDDIRLVYNLTAS